MKTITIYNTSDCIGKEYVLVNYKEIIEWYKQPFYMKWFTKCPVKILKEIEI